jgi:hypothetical protein
MSRAQESTWFAPGAQKDDFHVETKQLKTGV